MFLKTKEKCFNVLMNPKGSYQTDPYVIFVTNLVFVEITGKQYGTEICVVVF